MQITHVEVIPVELKLRLPYQAVYPARIECVETVFIRIETRQGDVAWGCVAFDPNVSGETLEEVMRVCRVCAERARDLNPLNTEYALAELAPLTEKTPSVRWVAGHLLEDLLAAQRAHVADVWRHDDATVPGQRDGDFR